VKDGKGRWAKYRLAPKRSTARPVAPAAAEGEDVVPLSSASVEIRRYLGQPKSP
jgi:hypothetical protein